MKRKILSITVIAICLAVLGYSTLAYFTDEAVTHNVITSGGIEIEVVEKHDDDGDKDTPLIDFPKAGVSGVMPGMDVSKIVSVRNLEEPAWVRIVVNPKGWFADDTAMWGTQLGILEFDFNDAPADVEGDAYWIYEDGCWYYSKPVAMDEETEVLFTTVHFDEEMGNEYQNAHFEIDIHAEAVQTANNPIPDGGDVTDIKGWPES